MESHTQTTPHHPSTTVNNDTTPATDIAHRKTHHQILMTTKSEILSRKTPMNKTTLIKAAAASFTCALTIPLLSSCADSGSPSSPTASQSAAPDIVVDTPPTHTDETPSPHRLNTHDPQPQPSTPPIFLQPITPLFTTAEETKLAAALPIVNQPAPITPPRPIPLPHPPSTSSNEPTGSGGTMTPDTALQLATLQAQLAEQLAAQEAATVVVSNAEQQLTTARESLTALPAPTNQQRTIITTFDTYQKALTDSYTWNTLTDSEKADVLTALIVARINTARTQAGLPTLLIHVNNGTLSTQWTTREPLTITSLSTGMVTIVDLTDPTLILDPAANTITSTLTVNGNHVTGTITTYHTSDTGLTPAAVTATKIDPAINLTPPKTPLTPSSTYTPATPLTSATLPAPTTAASTPYHTYQSALADAGMGDPDVARLKATVAAYDRATQAVADAQARLTTARGALTAAQAAVADTNRRISALRAEV